MANTHTFTKREELANALTHGAGVLLSVAALVLLIVFAAIKGGALLVVSCTIFGSSMLLLYTASTLVHSFPEGRAKRVFEILDHAFIYVFIAGTYTPIVLHLVQGAAGWTLFGIVWGAAIVGCVFKAFYASRFVFISTLIYLAMGWVIVFAWQPLVSRLEPGGLIWLIAGGVLYSVGTVFYMWRSFRFHHAVWHGFVLGGSAAHFVVVFFYVIPHG